MQAFVIAVLLVHLAWIAFVIFGALLTRGKRWLTGAHLLALTWGIVVEVGPWPCPLTLLELSCDRHAGLPAYGGGCMAHALDGLIYPDLPDVAITALGVGICCLNLALYAHRLWIARSGKRLSRSAEHTR